MIGKKLPKTLKFAIRSLPLVGASATVFLPLHRAGQQFVMLIVLIWLQVFFVLELFLASK